jgi:hypothetical protein
MPLNGAELAVDGLKGLTGSQALRTPSVSKLAISSLKGPAKAGPEREPPMKTYCFHNCSKTHRTFSAMSKCVWGRGTRVEGEGAYAVVHWFRVGRLPRYADVLLYKDANEAKERFEEMSSPYYCGGSCRNAGGRHELVRIDLEGQRTR